MTQGVTFFQALVSISNKEGLLMPGMNGEVTIRAADLSQVLQMPIDAIRPTNELAPVARMFGLSVDTITNQMRKDLLGTEGTTGVPGRYVVVALPDGSLRDAPREDRPDRSSGAVDHRRAQGRRQGRDAGCDHHGQAGDSRRPFGSRRTSAVPTATVVAPQQVGAAGTQAGQPAATVQPTPATAKPGGGGEPPQATQAGPVRKP